MTLTHVPRSMNPQAEVDARIVFSAFGSHWAVVAMQGEGGAGAKGVDGPVVGEMHFEGRAYAIVPCLDDTVGQSPTCFGRRIADDVLQALTPRELQVCELIAAGRCDKQIARTLAISGYTVREHIRRIFAKLHISRRSAVPARLIGIAQPESGE